MFHLIVFGSCCVLALAAGSCSTVKLVDLGTPRERFDSAQVTLTRNDRLAYVQLFSYETKNHAAGEMSKDGKIDSYGIKAPFQSTYHYQWEGSYSLVSPDEKLDIRYHSLLGDVIIGDYALDVFGWLSTKPRNEDYQALVVSGNISGDGDSADFLFYTGERGLTTMSEGYMVFRADTLFFKPVTSEVLKGKTMSRVSYGYGLYLKDSLVAAVDFEKKPQLVYLHQQLPPGLARMVTGFLSIAAGNYRIVPRRSTVLKRFV